MSYKKRGNMKKKKRDNKLQGLRVDVRYNNVEFALKKFKRIIKNSGIMMELKERQYYKKKSTRKRERINTAKARNKYQMMKDQNNY
tara:strand:+ start:297 stop:554 length:258 start_codon:yes stop_codon:yes gene_type:complete